MCATKSTNYLDIYFKLLLGYYKRLLYTICTVSKIKRCHLLKRLNPTKQGNEHVVSLLCIFITWRRMEMEKKTTMWQELDRQMCTHNSITCLPKAEPRFTGYHFQVSQNCQATQFQWIQVKPPLWYLSFDPDLFICSKFDFI